MLVRRSLLSAIAVLLLTSPALSQSISLTVPNYDFSTPYVAPVSPYAAAGFGSGNWQVSSPPAWWAYGSDAWYDQAGVFVNVPSEWIDNLVPSGGTLTHQQAAFVYDTPGLELSQTLSSTFQVGQSYQLTVGIAGGGGGMQLGSSMEIGLYYLDGNGNQDLLSMGTATVTNDDSDLSSGTAGGYVDQLTDYSLTIPAVAASDPWAGQNIGIALIQGNNTDGAYWDIDNVRLTATAVPEPGSMALLAAGLGMLVLGRRWSLKKTDYCGASVKRLVRAGGRR